MHHSVCIRIGFGDCSMGTMSDSERPAFVAYTRTPSYLVFTMWHQARVWSDIYHVRETLLWSTKERAAYTMGIPLSIITNQTELFI
jgi:hypothetical protein